MMWWAIALLQPAALLTVCDVMPELTRFDGKLVKITGIFHSSYHLTQLEGDGCQKHFVTKGYQWQDALMLAFTDSHLGPRLAGKSIQFGFVSNKDSMKLLERAKEREKIDTSRRRIRVLLEGMILTGGSEYLVDNVLGPSSVDGFGFGGQAPAVLVIKDLHLAEVVNAKGEVLPEPKLQ